MKPIIKEAKKWKLDFDNYIEARWIMKNRQYLTINDFVVDMQSAQAMVLVYDSANEKNQNKIINKIPIEKFAKFVFGSILKNGK